MCRLMLMLTSKNPMFRFQCCGESRLATYIYITIKKLKHEKVYLQAQSALDFNHYCRVNNRVFKL